MTARARLRVWPLPFISPTRNLTILRIRGKGKGSSIGNWIEPFPVL